MLGKRGKSIKQIRKCGQGHMKGGHKGQEKKMPEGGR